MHMNEWLCRLIDMAVLTVAGAVVLFAVYRQVNYG